jgi:hypothetical protein
MVSMNVLEKILKKKSKSPKSGATGATLLQNDISHQNNYKKTNTLTATKVLQTATELKFCPAMGKWPEKGPGWFCFYRSYFEGKPGQPIHLDLAQKQCPMLKKNSGGEMEQP